MPRRKVTDDLPEVLELTLQALAEPMHYLVLTDLLVSSGAWAGRGGCNEKTVYSTMHNDILRRGEDSPFRFLGDGVFCASTVRGVDLVAVKREGIRQNRRPQDPAAKRQHESRQEHERRIKRMSEEARCGNCEHLEYDGPYALRMTRGYCGKWRVSGFVGRANSDKPCEAWERRSNAKQERDMVQRNAVAKAVDDIVTGKGRKKK